MLSLHSTQRIHYLNNITTSSRSIEQPGWADGDSWIQYKGRAVPPGPEKRRGRQNLTETFQQTSNPYQVGRDGKEGEGVAEDKLPRDLLVLLVRHSFSACAGY